MKFEVFLLLAMQTASLLLIAAVVFLVIVIVRQRKRYKERLRNSFCQRCGYDLCDIGEVLYIATCPECGNCQPMAYLMRPRVERDEPDAPAPRNIRKMLQRM
jgi:predicted Zn-ribbon and HTH transcriptional regulator